MEGSRRIPGFQVLGVDWFQASSGLWVPAERHEPQRAFLQMSGGAGAGGDIFAVLNRMPTFMDQVHAFIDEAALGLPVSSSEELIERVKTIGFESGAFATAYVAMWIDEQTVDATEQIAYARAIFSESAIAARVEDAITAGRGRIVVSEQHLVALQRLLVLHARPAVFGDMSQEEAAGLERALLGMSALTLDASERETGEPREEFDVIASLVQNGAFNAKEPLFETLARTATIFMAETSDDLRARSDYCDVDDWARDATGLPLHNQFAVGLAALAVSGALKSGRPEVGDGFLSGLVEDLAERIGAGEDAVRDFLSADRDWYAAAFPRLESRFDVAPEAAAAGWNRVPFETRPFLRLADGRLMLWSPRTAIGWITDGFYFRALDTATAIGREAAFRTYYGALVEDYVCTVLEETFPEPRPIGSGRVHREQQYRVPQGHRRSPDAAIDYGQDLVFVEVTSGRLSFETRVGGDPARVGKDLARLITGKAMQLSARIDDYFADCFAIDGVERSHVRRVWPIVVTASGLLMSEPLHAYLHHQIGDALQQPGVRSLTVMDLADLEQMCALVEAGHSIPDLLGRKAGGYRGLDWRRMVNEDPYLPTEVRFSGMERRSDALWMNAVQAYGWDPEQFRAERRQRQGDEQP